MFREHQILDSYNHQAYLVEYEQRERYGNTGNEDCALLQTPEQVIISNVSDTNANAQCVLQAYNVISAKLLTICRGLTGKRGRIEFSREGYEAR